MPRSGWGHRAGPGCRIRSRCRRPWGWPRERPYPGPWSEILTGPHPLDGASALGLVLVADERPDVDDALTFLARDLGPVVRIGGVGKVLILLVLLTNRLEQIVGADPPRLVGDGPFDGQLLGPADDVLDHRPGGEVPVVQHFLV